MRYLTQIFPRRFQSADTVWRLAGGNEDNDLWALNHEDCGGPAVTSVFVPDDEQRKQIAEGANIALTVLGAQPPVKLRLTDEPLGKPSALGRPSARPSMAGEICHQCGGMMQRTGSCHTCPNCGSTTGCG